MKKESKELTVGELIQRLRMFDPSYPVITSGLINYVGVTTVESFVVWEDDDDTYGDYTADLARGRANTGRAAIHIRGKY